MKANHLFIVLIVLSVMFITSVSAEDNITSFDVPSSVDVNSSKIVSVPVTSNNSIEKSDLSVKINQTQEDINDFTFSQSTISFNYNLNTSSNLLIFYKNITKNVLINRIYNAEFVSLQNEAEYSSGNFTFQMLDTDNNYTPLSDMNVKITGKYAQKSLIWTNMSGSSVSVNSHINLKSDENGIITLPNSGFYPGTVYTTYIFSPVGNYTFTLSASNEAKGSKSFNAAIKKASVNITVEAFREYVDTAKPVLIHVVNAKTGEPVKGTLIHVYIPNTDELNYYFTSNENGTCKAYVSKLYGGTYTLSVSNTDTENFTSTSVTSQITLVGKPTLITAKFTSPYYFNTGRLVSIKVTDKNTGKALSGVFVSVKIDSTTKYYKTNSKGIVNINFAPMKVGKHKIKISIYDSRRYSANTVSKTVNVKKAKVKIKISKVKTYYKQKAYVTVKVTNKANGKPVYMAKQYVKFYVNKNKYNQYYAQTGIDGKMRVIFDNYKPGKHKIVVTANDAKNFTQKTATSKVIIKKTTAKLTAKKLTSKKGTANYFKVTVKNKKTKKILTGGVKLKVKVFTGKKYKTYTIKSNSKGIARFNVKSLKKGNHRVVVSSKTKYVKAKSLKSKIKITS